MIKWGAAGKGGWPWHGLWRFATNQIETSPPKGYIGDSPDNGDTYLVQIPGLPEPVTTPEEAALGLTWKNWALISGSNHVLYGKSIDSRDHIYIDPDGKPWRVRLTLAGNRLGGEISVGAYFWPFGVLGPVVAGSSSYLTPVSVGFALHPDYPPTVGGGPVVLDIAKNGGKALVGIQRATSGFAAIAEVTITGRPGDGTAALAISLKWDELGVESWPSTYASSYDYQWLGWFVQPVPCPTPDPPPPPPWLVGSSWVNGIWYGYTGSFWFRDVKSRVDLLGSEPPLLPVVEGNDGMGVYQASYRVATSIQRWRVAVELSGARYDTAGNATVVTTTTTDGYAVSTSSMTPDPETTVSYATYGETIPACAFSGTATSISGAVLETASGNSDYTVTRAITFGGEIDFKLSFNVHGSARINYSTTTTTPNGESSSASYYRTGEIASPYYYPPGFDLLPTQVDGIGLRYSNRVYGVRSAKFDHAGSVYNPSIRVYGPAIGVMSSVSAYVVASTIAERPSYATEHPLTGGCQRATTPICYM